MNEFDRRALLAALASLTALPAIAQESEASDTEETMPAETETAPAEVGPGYVTGDLVLGAEDAPVTVIEYASLTCPHCARFHAVTWPEVKKAYVDTGKIRFIMREVYFDQYGLWAAMTARCGDGSKYHWMIDKFLVEQQAWTRAEDLAGAIRQIGRRAGLSTETLNACLTDREYAKALLETYKVNQQADQIESTPTFIINGEQHSGNMSFEAFSALIDPHLQG